jgi:CheY-like chemotaxis protein
MKTIAPHPPRVSEDRPRVRFAASGSVIFWLASMRRMPIFGDTGCVGADLGLRILIVDDNRHFLAAARDVLEQDGLTVVGTALTSAEALTVAAEVRPDAILVDVDLGEESGFDLAQRLAAANGSPVVLISVYAEAELSDLIAASSAVGFLSKAELSGRNVSDLLGRDHERSSSD